jgi:glycosyltransferase involved in cell wall biosynthesis
MKNKKIKIAIDISPLNDGNALRGVGFYTKHLVDALQHEVKVNPDYQNFQIDLIVNSKLKIENYDLVHYPYFDPFKLTLPPKKIPTIITIHDIIERQFKKHYPVGLKGEIKWLIQRFLAQQANHIITVSHYSKHLISEYLNYPVDRIFVTYEAADSIFRPIKKPINKYNLPQKFVLYVGDINWNKNVPSLVKACLQLKYPLVIVGSSAVKEVPIHPWTQDIHWLQSIKSPLISCLGFVKDEDLPHIYNLATIYCQPSFAEGFGLPVVEAMSCGTPVIYSHETSLPEVMDFNGHFFDPYSKNGLNRALQEVWTDSGLQQEYRTKGLARSKTFSWQQTAIQTLYLYKLTLLDEKTS